MERSIDEDEELARAIEASLNVSLPSRVPKRVPKGPHTPLRNPGVMCHSNALLHILADMKEDGLFSNQKSFNKLCKSRQQDPSEDLERMKQLGYIRFSLTVKQWYEENRCRILPEHNMITKPVCLRLNVPDDDIKLSTLIDMSMTEESGSNKFLNCISVKKIVSLIGDRYLLISLDRSEPLKKKGKKRQTDVVFEGRVTLNNYQLRLMGMVYHIGNDINGGHYIACSRIGTDLYIYDDKKAPKIANGDEIFDELEKKGVSMYGDVVMLLYSL
jgi:hypothetical protein